MNIQDTLSLLNQGKWIQAGAKDSPEISDLLTKCAEICFQFNSLSPVKTHEREALIRSLFGSCGDRPVIHSPFRCDFGFNIHIGNNFIGNFNLSILDEARVSIGNNVMIGPNCSLITITHALDAAQRNDGVMKAKPITIGNNVWIASNVAILPGVTIGDNSVIGAGSVVTKDIPANVLAVGTPCGVFRPIADSDRVHVSDPNKHN